MVIGRRRRADRPAGTQHHPVRLRPRQQLGTVPYAEQDEVSRGAESDAAARSSPKVTAAGQSPPGRSRSTVRGKNSSAHGLHEGRSVFSGIKAIVAGRRGPETVELRIPKLRKGSYFPCFLAPCRVAERRICIKNVRF